MRGCTQQIIQTRLSVQRAQFRQCVAAIVCVIEQVETSRIPSSEIHAAQLESAAQLPDAIERRAVALISHIQRVFPPRCRAPPESQRDVRRPHLSGATACS